jgi:membrane protein YqaA with SNARE-associated domain
MKSKKLKKIDYFLIIFGLVLLILTVILIFNPELGGFLTLERWTSSAETTDLLGGLVAVSIACVLGAIVPVPIPYIIVVAIVAFNLWTIPFTVLNILYFIIIVLVSTITNLIGDALDYIIGLGARKLKESSAESIKVNKNNQKKSNEQKGEENRWARIIYSKPKLIPYIIFLFGCTPLPDSLLLMPLGVVKYDIKKTMLWSAVGKLLMMLVVSIVGIVSLSTIESLFGGENWIVGMAVLWASYFLIILMVKID